MEYLCLGFVCFGAALVLVAVVGHALWVAATGAFKKVYTEPEKPPLTVLPVLEPARKRCVGCGGLLRGGVERCPNCHLEPVGPVALELQDLETTARQIQGLVDAGSLDAGLG